MVLSPLWLASAAEAIEVLTGIPHTTREGIPPPGTTLQLEPVPPFAYPVWPFSTVRLPWAVSGVPDVGGSNDWWHTTVSAFLDTVGVEHSQILLSLAAKLADAASGVGLTANQWPVIMRGTERRTVKWQRVTTRGTLGGGVEQFQFKLDFGKPGDDQDFSEQQLMDLAETVGTYWGLKWSDPTDGSIYPQTTRIVEVGAAQLTQSEAKDVDGEGGNLESTETQWWMLTPPGQGGSSTSPSLPFEVACAVTLQTAHRGPSGRGRCYLPPFAVTGMQGTKQGCFQDAYATYAAQSIVDLFAAVTGATPLVPVVVSSRRLILNEIVSVNVGIVPDSQRRRRKSQDEARIHVWGTV